jgi:hypothetical protein
VTAPRLLRLLQEVVCSDSKKEIDDLCWLEMDYIATLTDTETEQLADAIAERVGYLEGN